MQCYEDRYGSITVPILRNPSRVRLRKGFPISIMTSTLGDAIPPEKLVLGISSLLTLSDLICYGNGSEYAIKSQLNHFISGEEMDGGGSPSKTKTVSPSLSPSPSRSRREEMARGFVSRVLVSFPHLLWQHI